MAVQSSFADRFIDTINIWTAIEKGQDLSRNAPQGLASAVAAFVFSIATVGFFWVTWTFDWAATGIAVDGVIGWLYSAGPGWLTAYISLQVFVNVAVFAPTIIEFIGPLFSRLKLSISTELTISLFVFDLVTDAPVLLAFGERIRPAFVGAGAFEPIVYHAFLLVGLVIVSAYAQLFFFACAVTAWGFFYQSMKGPVNAKRY